MTDASGDRNPIDELAEEFARRYRQGERPSLSEYLARYPQLASEIREVLPALVAMEQLKPEIGEVAPRPPAPGKPDRIGDYRILREVGRGGMGVVYEAEQLSLGRRVALKVLPHHLENPKYLERFRREARAAARLHHSNIVPVFGVGECDGVHFYAMQFIAGEGLDRVLADLRRLREMPGSNETTSVATNLLSGQFGVTERPGPSVGRPGSRALASESSGGEYHRAVARVGLQVAEALAYAHGHGIVHRDIKPSNLILDLRGTVWVTDFGLAKADDSGQLTGTGDIVGTLRYMAPERFEGSSLPAGDVYALGISLYEMLTLRPAFEDESPARLIQSIVSSDPPRPRRLDGCIPRDLETIVLGACARDPSSRYASAEALAEDLRRFLSDRPIRARRASVAERSWRWCRRNPAVAVLGASVFLLLLTTAIGASIGVWRLERLLARAVAAEANLNEKVQDLERAERAAQETLFESYLGKAQAQRRSQRPGQRFATLDTIVQATRLARELRLSGDQFRRLRTKAIGALAHMDLRLRQEWPHSLGTMIAYDLDLRHYAGCDRQGEIHLRAVGSETDLAWSSGVRFSAATWLSVGHEGGYLGVWDQVRGRMVLLRRDQNRLLPILELPANVASRPVFTPDGRSFLYVLRDGTAIVLDLARGTRRLLPPVQGTKAIHGARPGIALHPEGRLLAVAVVARGQRVVQVRDIETGRIVFSTDADPGISTVPVWHPSGRLLAVANSSQIRIWDLVEGTQVANLFASHTGGLELAFDPSGELLASTDWNGETCLWETHSGFQLLRANTTMGTIQFSRDGRSLAGGLWGVGKGQVWEVPRRCYRRIRPMPQGINDSGSTPLVSPDGRTLAVGYMGRVCLWDLHSGEPLATLGRLGVQFPWLAYDRHGSLWTYANNGVRRWPAPRPGPGDLVLGPPERVPSSSQKALGCFSLDRTGNVVVGRDSLGQWVLHRGSPTRLSYMGTKPEDGGILVSPDGRWLALADTARQKVRIHDAASGKLIRQLPCADCKWLLAISPDGTWISAWLGERGLVLWRTDTWETRGPFMGTPGIAFAPDNRFAAVETGEGRVRLVDPETGHELAMLEDPNQDITSYLEVSPDGTKLLTTSWRPNQAIHIWDLRRLREELTALGLDWNQKAYPPQRPSLPAGPRKYQVDHGTLPLDPEPALILYSLAFALQPLNLEALVQRASAHASLAHDPDTWRDCDLALALDPSSARAWFLRGQLRAKRGESAQALADYGTAIRHAPREAQFRRSRAALASRLGERRLARADYEKLAEWGSATAAELGELAWHLALGPPEERDVPGALRLARRAVELEPENGSHQVTLGLALWRNLCIAEAITSLERGLAKSQGAPRAIGLFVLAACHQRTGNATRAKERFAEALQQATKIPAPNRQHTEVLKAIEMETAGLLRGR